MNALPRKALIEAFSKFGDDLLRDPTLLRPVLLTICSGYLTEDEAWRSRALEELREEVEGTLQTCSEHSLLYDIDILILAAMLNVPEQLRQTVDDMMYHEALGKVSRDFEPKCGSYDVAKWVVESWGIALGLGKSTVMDAIKLHVIGHPDEESVIDEPVELNGLTEAGHPESDGGRDPERSCDPGTDVPASQPPGNSWDPCQSSPEVVERVARSSGASAVSKVPKDIAGVINWLKDAAGFPSDNDVLSSMDGYIRSHAEELIAGIVEDPPQHMSPEQLGHIITRIRTTLHGKVDSAREQRINRDMANLVQTFGDVERSRKKRAAMRAEREPPPEQPAAVPPGLDQGAGPFADVELPGERGGNPMALILCQDCKEKISNEAHSCPHCGRPTPLGKEKMKPPVYSGPAPPGVQYAICPYCSKEIRVTVPEGFRLVKVARWELGESLSADENYIITKAKCVHEDCREKYRVHTRRIGSDHPTPGE
ncbi:hypothetical protein ACFL6C_03985 [Myxococcota bacterium]